MSYQRSSSYRVPGRALSGYRVPGRALRGLEGMLPIPGTFRGLPMAIPGPGGGPPQPNFPASIFPTTARWGDVLNVSGPFGGMFQGDIVVQFEGAPAVSPSLTGPYGGAVIVPDGARTGLCTIEVQGRRVFGTNCVITPATQGQGAPTYRKGMEPWGARSQLRGLGCTSCCASCASGGPCATGGIELKPRCVAILGGVALAAYLLLR